MTAIDQARKLIDEEHFDEIEDLWLGRLSENVEDLEFYSGVAAMLTRAKEKELATFLLELLDEQLREGQLWESRLVLLESSGRLFLEAAVVHAAAMSSMAALYHDCPSFELFAKKVGLHRAIEDTPKVWSKAHRLRSLMQFDDGSFVWMQDKGPGKVVEVNMELESFKIELTDLPALRVGFAAAAKLLQPLPKDHIERRKLEDLPALQELKNAQPGELLLVALQSHETALTTAEIRKALTGIVDDDEWKSWWAAAKKHPQVLASSTKGRHTYGWAASGDHALEDVRQRFASADVGEQLEILRKNAERDPRLRDEMITELQELAESSLERAPDISLKIWYALDKLNATAELSWSPSSIVELSRNPVSLIASQADKAIRDRLWELLREVRQDWPPLYKKAIAAEQDARLLTHLADRLGSVEPDELKSVVDDILGHSRRYPAAFVWLAESGETYAALTERNPLRLIRQGLDALHQSEFSSYKSRVHKTFETGGGATHLFAKLTEEQATQAEAAIQRAPLEEHLRDSLIRYLHVRFPSLDDTREAPLYATRESIEIRRQELEKLKLEEIPANRKAIEEAREMGDLRENFEYKSARQRHEYLNARLASLQGDLSRVQPIASDKTDFGEVRVGCRVDLETSDGGSRSITVLGPWESDPDRHIVSYDSDLGKDLLGKQPGEAITLDQQSWNIKAIGPPRD